MLKLCSQIEFSREGSLLYTFNYICEIEIQTSWDLLTQTAKIEIPNAFRTKDMAQTIINNILLGDEIRIYTGYVMDNINKKSGSDLVTRFVGYVTKIKPGYVVKIECEDMMWKLKQTVLDGYSKVSPVTLKQLISDIQGLTGLDFKVDIISTSDLGTVVIAPGNSFCDVLEFIKTKYLVLIYFRNKVLYVRRPIQFIGNPKGVFVVQKNIIGADTLEYQVEKDVKLMVKMTNQLPKENAADEKKTIYCFYDAKGVFRSSTTPHEGYNQIEHTSIAPGKSGGLKSDEELKTEAKEIIQSQTYTGYKGDFETFGEPVMQFGDYATIKDYKYPERTGNMVAGQLVPYSYLIRSNTITFGKKGYRQKIGIYGIKV